MLSDSGTFEGFVDGGAGFISADAVYECFLFGSGYIYQLDVDQRKVNMLAGEYYDAVASGKSGGKKKRKPVILSHHMLYLLKEGQEKISKSDPN